MLHVKHSSSGLAQPAFEGVHWVLPIVKLPQRHSPVPEMLYQRDGAVDVVSEFGPAGLVESHLTSVTR